MRRHCAKHDVVWVSPGNKRHDTQLVRSTLIGLRLGHPHILDFVKERKDEYLSSLCLGLTEMHVVGHMEWDWEDALILTSAGNVFIYHQILCSARSLSISLLFIYSIRYWKRTTIIKPILWGPGTRLFRQPLCRRSRECSQFAPRSSTPFDNLNMTLRMDYDCLGREPNPKTTA